MSAAGDHTGTVLPVGVVTLLDGHDLADHVGVTIQLLTVDAEGWPRVALLSVGEVVVLDGSHLRLALWPNSRTTANLRRSGIGVLALVHAGASHSVRIEAEAASGLAQPTDRAVFDARVLEVRSDEVPYAVLTGGIAFDLPDPASVLERWRRTVDALVAGAAEPVGETNGRGD
jgi:hypothetical protein